MRKLCAAVAALVSALAFLLVGSAPANALGSEVLGCSIDFAWTANSCSGTHHATGTLSLINFEPHNLSGTYTTSWTVTAGTTTPVTNSCSSTFSNVPCIYGGGGCTAGSMSCMVATRVDASIQTFTAALTLTQSGQTLTLVAQATVKDSIDGGCPRC